MFHDVKHHTLVWCVSETVSFKSNNWSRWT